jgi:cysteine-S-conjugate beta-lyase
MMNIKLNAFDKIIDRKNTNSIKWDLFGKDILPLWVADMDFASPPEIISAIRARLDHPIFGYQSRDEGLLKFICNWVSSHYGWLISPEEILLIPGVVAGFNWAVQSNLEPGSSIIFQTPIYFPFYKISKNNNVNQITVPLVETKSGYEIDFDFFESQISQDTAMFIFCNPHNPTGRVFRKDELTRLGDICLAHEILICSDEIHCDLIYPGHSHIPIASLSEELAQNTITLMAPSKTFNIPGLEFSFAVVKNENLRKKMENSRNGVVGKPSILACAAAKAAYEFGNDWLIDVLDYLDKNRKYVFDFFQENIPEIKMHLPEGTYLTWLDCSDVAIQGNPFKHFLENAKVALNDGAMFDESYNKFVRLNFACPKIVLEEALQKMTNSIGKL